MTAAQHTPRPSRTYRDGVGKPVVKKVYDEVLDCYQWAVVFPPRNNWGAWIVEPEAILGNKAEDLCDRMNLRAFRARAAIAQAEKGGAA